MTDTTTFGHVLIGFRNLLLRQPARIHPLPRQTQETELKPSPGPDPDAGRRKRRVRQQTKPSLAKRHALRKVRNRMARESRRRNRP